MALLDRFRAKPEWQSPDPMVRAEAVRHLPAHEQALLGAIAREDADARVRRAAVKKLSDAAALGAVREQDGDEAVREEAAEALVALALRGKDDSALAAVAGLSDARHLAAVAKAAVLESARRAALDRITDAKALGGVAREAEDAAIRLDAVTRIEDGPTLLGLALRCEHKAVALAAVEKLRDAEDLHAVAARARVGAAARRAAALLEGRPGEAPEEAAPEEAPPEVALDVEEERRRAEDERRYAQDARLALCEKLEAAPDDAVLTGVEEARAAWARLPALPAPESDVLAERFQRACAQALLRHEASLAAQATRAPLEHLCAEAERVAEGEDLAQARREWAALHGRWKEAGATVAEALRARFEKAEGRLRAREDEAREEQVRHERQNRARLEGLCERLERLLAADTFPQREGERALREAREAGESTGPLPSRREREALLARLEAARKALYPRVQQAREDAEWKRWANEAIEEALCAEAEALLAVTDLEQAARRLRDLDIRWKQAAEAPKEKAEALWQRFKSARDQVRARCDDYFAQRERDWAANLERKESLCERIEALAESTDWVRTAEEIKRLQGEWKRIGPVPRKQAKALWERFRKPCDRFFSRRAQDRKERAADWAENLRQKEALCAQAEALAESTDWEPAAAEIKRLQAEWRRVGPVKRSRSEGVWHRFRSACDRFFDRYKHRHEIAREASLAAREELCRELEALAPKADAAETPAPPEDLLARVQAAQAAWRQSGALPAGQEALAERFTAARDRLISVYPERFSGTDLDPAISRRKLEKLCARVEALLAELEPAEATGADLAEQLRRALASNTIGGRGAAEARWQSALQEAEAAQLAARRLGPIPGEAGQALRERFDGACRRLSAMRPRKTGSRAGGPPSPRTSTRSGSP